MVNNIENELILRKQDSNALIKKKGTVRFSKDFDIN